MNEHLGFLMCQMRSLLQKSVETFGILSGLSLTEIERSLFDPKLISPSMALGNKKTINIITYQLNQAVCPHID